MVISHSYVGLPEATLVKRFRQLQEQNAMERCCQLWISENWWILTWGRPTVWAGSPKNPQLGIGHFTPSKPVKQWFIDPLLKVEALVE